MKVTILVGGPATGKTTELKRQLDNYDFAIDDVSIVEHPNSLIEDNFPTSTMSFVREPDSFWSTPLFSRMQLGKQTDLEKLTLLISVLSQDGLVNRANKYGFCDNVFKPNEADVIIATRNNEFPSKLVKALSELKEQPVFDIVEF